MLYKQTAGTIKDVDETKGIVEAYWSAFGNMDSDGDIISPGAYAKTIQERGPKSPRPRIKMLWMHDWWNPIGYPVELSEDSHGLRAVSKVSKTTQGRDALILYRDGVITEHSVGIDVIKRASDERGSPDARVIQEVRLWEGSPVTWGSNPLTPTISTRSFEGDLAATWRKMIEQSAAMRAALRSGISDELAFRIEATLEQWEAALKCVATPVDPWDSLGEELDKAISLSRREPDESTSDGEPSFTALIDSLNNLTKQSVL